MEPGEQPVWGHRLSHQRQAFQRIEHQGVQERGGLARDGGPGCDHYSGRYRSSDYRRLCGRGRAGRDCDFGWIQRARRSGEGTGAADSGADSGNKLALDRAELPGRDEPGERTECDLCVNDRAAGQCGLHQPERGLVYGDSGLGAEGDGRVQCVRFGGIDARCRLGRPDRLPGK